MSADNLLPPGTALGAVHLRVTDPERARLFWTRYVGLTELPSETNGGPVRLGTAGREVIRLHPGATEPAAPRSTGLYHVAIHVPTQRDLARTVARLHALHWPNAPTDHTCTMATYLSDPDGIGIEITFETPGRGELFMDESGRPAARLHATGELRGPTEALDLRELLAALDESEDLTLPAGAGTRIGHVHLHIRDLEESRRFYADTVGFHPLLHVPGFGMSDFTLQGYEVPHALAVNTWAGRGAAPAPESTAGLLRWELALPDAAALEQVVARLRAAGHPFDKIDADSMELTDPSGNQLQLTAGGEELQDRPT